MGKGYQVAIKKSVARKDKEKSWSWTWKEGRNTEVGLIH